MFGHIYLQAISNNTSLYFLINYKIPVIIFISSYLSYIKIFGDFIILIINTAVSK